jgi:hypothetical protein
MRGLVLAVCMGIALFVGACAPAPPSTGPMAIPSATPSRSHRIGLTRAEAVAIARVAAQAPAEWDILQADVGGPADVVNFQPSPSSPPSTPGPGSVWRVNVGFIDGPLDGQGVIVFIDYFDGHVIAKTDWIS